MHSTVFERSAPEPAVVSAALANTRQAVFWLDDVATASRESLAGTRDADLVVVGGGYCGLWTAIRAKERNPDARVILLEAKTIGWAASGRNGGFVEASLTHGDLNGERRWPEELEQLNRLGHENLDAIAAAVKKYRMKIDFERTGTLSVALEPHELEWLADAGDVLDQTQVRAEVSSPTYLGGAWDKTSTALVHPGKFAAELARVATDLGVDILEHSPVRRIESDGVSTVHGRVRAPRIALATNVFPSLLARNRLMTVPVYDYVLMTEPLSKAQLASIGWKNRQGIADLANQFHYYRLSADNRILFGGYDAIYHSGGRVRSQYENRPASFRRLAGHFFTTFPQLEGLTFTHQWAGAIDTSTRFCAFFGTARGGRVAYAAGFTGLGVAATRFAADVMLDKLDGIDTELTQLRMVRERPLPFPPEPAASVGINLTRRSLNRADHREGNRDILLKTLDALGLGFDS
jgi:glycine/D-amino acid oxidase-like deaminating enzyme